jgi:hypothetical protein
VVVGILMSVGVNDVKPTMRSSPADTLHGISGEKGSTTSEHQPQCINDTQSQERILVKMNRKDETVSIQTARCSRALVDAWDPDNLREAIQEYPLVAATSILTS